MEFHLMFKTVLYCQPQTDLPIVHKLVLSNALLASFLQHSTQYQQDDIA